MKRNKIIVIDFECSCWPKEANRSHDMEIIEIGICVYHIPSGEISDKRSFIVRPKLLEISDYCTNLTGITLDKIKEGHPLNEVLNTMEKLYPLRSATWGGWGESDRRHLTKECFNKKIEYPFNDSMGYLNIKTLCQLFLRRSKGLGLEKALKALELEFEGKPHSGADDAYNAARILQHLLSEKD